MAPWRRVVTKKDVKPLGIEDEVEGHLDSLKVSLGRIEEIRNKVVTAIEALE